MLVLGGKGSRILAHDCLQEVGGLKLENLRVTMDDPHSYQQKMIAAKLVKTHPIYQDLILSGFFIVNLQYL